MKHKPFEEWIFSDDEPTPAERKALYDHLRECDPCYQIDRSWRRVETLIRDPNLIPPPDGFSDRWLIRLQEDRKRRAERQSLAMLFVTSMSAGMFLLLFGIQLFARLPDVVGPVLAGYVRSVQLLSFIQTFLSGLVQNAGLLQPAVPVFVVMGFFALLGGSAILWLKMFRTLARVQGMQQWA